MRRSLRRQSLILAAAGLLFATVPAVASPTAGTWAAGTASAGDTMAPRCTPGYSPCIRNKASDVDCHGGGGNGPRYTKPGVVYRVTGRDRYGLDSDDNGRACERN